MTRSYAQQVPHALDSMLNKSLSDQQTKLKHKGLCASLILPNGAVWSGAAGISAENEPMDTNMTLGIGSVTKTITAASVLKLADEKLLNLDDSLYKWLDTFQYINPHITIRQLLRHQSGLFDIVNANGFQDVLWNTRDSIWKLKDVINTFINPPLFAPGAKFQYCNTNYLLLGLICEKVTNKNHYDLFREQFIDPLHLNVLHMQPFETKQNIQAHVWLDLDGDGIIDDAQSIFDGWSSFDAATSSAGSYYSNSANIASWIRAYLKGTYHSQQILNEAKTTVTTTFPNGVKYGLGMMNRSFLGNIAYGHGGDFGYSASVWYFPQKDISIAVLNNDGSKNSWTLGPVVEALLKVYLDFQIASKLKDQAEQAFVNLYPMPFSDKLILESNNDGINQTESFEIYSLIGERIMSGEVNHNANKIMLENLESIPHGSYYLSFRKNNSTLLVQKVFK